MRIIASSAFPEPRFLPTNNGGFDLVLHFGHTVEDILRAADGCVPLSTAQDFAALWSDPKHPRHFEELGGSLVITPG